MRAGFNFDHLRMPRNLNKEKLEAYEKYYDNAYFLKLTWALVNLATQMNGIKKDALDSSGIIDYEEFEFTLTRKAGLYVSKEDITIFTSFFDSADEKHIDLSYF